MMWATPTQQDSRIGPDNIGGSRHRIERGSVALADQVLFQYPTPAGPDDSVNRTHRLKALGNGIVPAVAYVFASAIADVLAVETIVAEERAA